MQTKQKQSINDIISLARETAHTLNNPAAWQSFLQLSTRLYRYSFPDQLLIYAQRPSATACASFELWRDRMRRYVKRGSKGIALIDNSGDWQRLKYVFDIADTGTSKRLNSRSPSLWRMRPEHNTLISKLLENSYGAKSGPLNTQVREASKQMAEAFCTGYESEVHKNADAFKAALAASIEYSLLYRCGQTADLDDIDFTAMNNISNLRALCALGDAVSEITKQLLMDIGTAIKEYDHNKERSSIDEKADLHSERRLSDTRSDDRRKNESPPRQIRLDMPELHATASEVDVPRTATVRWPDELSARNRPGSEEPNRANNGGITGTEPASGQSKRPDGLGATYEQPAPSGGRNGAERAGIQLTLFPPEQETLEKIEREEPKQETLEPPQYHKPINYRITGEEIEGGAKTRFKNNIEAIRTLHAIETENRLATSHEQATLAKYVGWGGLPQAFDLNSQSWHKEYTELRSMLSNDEYSAARGSTLNAHYTSPVVISAMYEAIERMGFAKGNILEPACGTGNFFGLLPESMQDSKLYGVELDSITGRIAQQLYQQADITVSGYEKTTFPNAFFDLAIGNVPFGGYKVADRDYDRLNFNIHDYFFAKTFDKVRPGGIIAFITSKGTMDKQNSQVRRYLAQRGELLGAVRLPNHAFQATAGTEVTTDILYFQKRDRPVDIEPDWVHLGYTEDGIPVNSYFADNPHMMLGRMDYDKSMYGNEKDTACFSIEGTDLSEQLHEAIQYIQGGVAEISLDDITELEQGQSSIPADPNVKNYSYTVVDGNIYYRENSRMHRLELPKATGERVRDMVGLRDCLHTLIDYQLNNYGDDDIQAQQQQLERLYDSFTGKHGLLNSRGNSIAFSDDSSYYLLCSLEILNEDGSLERKADIFSKRTILQHVPITHVDTASEALAVSIGEKACVDLDYMHLLTSLSQEQIAHDLEGVIYRVPSPKTDNSSIADAAWVTADEYLSGNVRRKLATAQLHAEQHPQLFSTNVAALEAAQPKDLDASEISVRLGASWVEPKYIQQFMEELLEMGYIGESIRVSYMAYTGDWNISNKSWNRGNVLANTTYGTARANAYRLIEDSLNQRDTRIYDTVEESDGSKRSVLNKKETMLAQQKQEAIKEAFKNWIWKDAQRRDTLVEKYNTEFNSIRPREYDGSHLVFSGINPEITLRPHQRDAIAHVLYGNNTLLAHEVGAGKTFEMVASAMEGKRLGQWNKCMFVVPNHLTEQTAAEFLLLYPAANILVARKKDFQTANRKKFCARIATGEYDAVIIGHSQFEKIPVSRERQERLLTQQMDEIAEGIEEMKRQNGERIWIKRLEQTKKSVETKLERLTNTGRKDDVVTFEQLGVDKLFVDEVQAFKNLFLVTKMRNVAGLSTSDAQKSSDLFLKCQYLDELTNNRGTVFATGTPVSNSMTELYTMMRYLQYDDLMQRGYKHFDSWAADFGETTTAIELAPEGTGYRARTRFAKFYNLPELMSLFKEAADIKTADILNLPTPEAIYHTELVQPSEYVLEMIDGLSERAAAIHNGGIDPSQDNMLKITNDGRKIGLDQRLMNDSLPEDPDGKVNICINNVYRIWDETTTKRSTQLIFCDMSTPKGDGQFNVYDEIKSKLIIRGVPEQEVAFIHDAKTEVQKKELFAKVRKGQVRVLLGSTPKMGSGTNLQDKLVALHDLDCPWRPADLAQRAGRIVRQGNENKQVHIFRYVTERTFDAYLYQTLETKQRFISQIMTSKTPLRSCEDMDATALSFAEIKALCAGNPLIKEKTDLDIQVRKLRLLKSNYQSQHFRLEDDLLKRYPAQTKAADNNIQACKSDIALLQQNTKPNSKGFSPMIIGKATYTEKEAAGKALLNACNELKTSKYDLLTEPQPVGRYRGMDMFLYFNGVTSSYYLTLNGYQNYKLELGKDVHGNITRINNLLDGLPRRMEAGREELKGIQKQVENTRAELARPFEHEQELIEKVQRLAEVDALLNLDEKDIEVLDYSVKQPAEAAIQSEEAEEERKLNGKSHSSLENKAVEQTRYNEILNSVRHDNDIDADRDKSREQFGFKDDIKPERKKSLAELAQEGQEEADRMYAELLKERSEKLDIIRDEMER